MTPIVAALPEIWNMVDVTELSGGPQGPGQGGVHAYIAQDQTAGAEGLTFYVTYLGLSKQGALEVHQLEYSVARGGWLDFNLSGAVPEAPPPAVIPASPSAYSFVAQGTRHVVYVASDAQANLSVAELWLDSNGWHYTPVTSAASAPAPAGAATLRAYTAEFERTQHVLSVTATGDIFELWWNDAGGWQWNDLTADTGAAPALVGQTVAGFTSDATATQHVYFVGRDARIYGLLREDGTWKRHDPPIAMPPAAPASAAGYLAEDGSERIVYIGTDGHIIELSVNGDAWLLEDVSKQTGVEADTSAAITAYSGLEGGSRTIVAIAADGSLIQRFHNVGNQWRCQQLAGPVGADFGARPGAFAARTMSLEFIFFPSIDFQISELSGPHSPETGFRKA